MPILLVAYESRMIEPASIARPVRRRFDSNGGDFSGNALVKGTVASCEHSALAAVLVTWLD